MTGWAQHDAEVHEDERETIRRLEEDNERLTAERDKYKAQLDDLLTGKTVVVPLSKEHSKNLLGVATTFWEGNAHIQGWKDR